MTYFPCDNDVVTARWQAMWQQCYCSSSLSAVQSELRSLVHCVTPSYMHAVLADVIQTFLLWFSLRTVTMRISMQCIILHLYKTGTDENLQNFLRCCSVQNNSDVPRILEWEGSRSYRLQRGWGVGIPSPLREGSGEGAVPRKFFVFFVENTIFWRILTRLFLKPSANSNTMDCSRNYLTVHIERVCGFVFV